MNDQSLEDLLRSLRPGPLPADLRERLATAPPATAPRPRRSRPRILWFAGAGLATAACTAILAVLVTEPHPSPAPGHQRLCVRRQQSTLVDTRPVTVLEHQGRLWEVAEQEWLDEDLVLCAATPLRVQLAATRREVVCRPVDFD